MNSEAEVLSSRGNPRRRGLAMLLMAALLGVLVNNVSGPASAATGDISTYAGTGIPGYSGDGGPATLAQMNTPVGVEVDSAGNVYFADWANNVVRRIDADTGVITTVAGTGANAYSGDGGPATSAAVGDPYDVALDSAGNLYITQFNFDVIRRVDAATGIITTVAGTGEAGFSGDGGPATFAQINEPYGVWVDSAGNVFFADSGNNRVRRIDAVTGIITTVAGSGGTTYGADGVPATAAGLREPIDGVVDAAGNLYITVFGQCRISRVDAVTGAITTVAGGNGCGSSGDGGPGTAAQINPLMITMDGAGNLFWTDDSRHRVRTLNLATGIIDTVAGTGAPGFSGDGGPATLAQLAWPYGVTVNAAGDLFIADGSNHRIRKVEAAGAPVTTTTTSTSTTSTTSTSTTSTSTTSTTLAPTTTTTATPGGVPTNKDQCKDGGWQSFGFKNQGQCVSFVNGRR